MLPMRQSSFWFGQRRPSVAVVGDEELGELPQPAFSFSKLMRHVGPGFLMCIAFIDPGNLEADLQTGATTGYELLWVLLLSTCMGFLLQSLASRLGVATGKHLAQHCAERYPPAARRTLWVMAELAIIGSDIQEVIGTAIALLLLTRGGLPLWAGVVLAAGAAYFLLLLERLGGRVLEVLFQVLVGVMSISFGLIFFSVDIPLQEVARGMLVPRLSREGIPTACALLGAIIMPHNLFLHSALVAGRKVGGRNPSSRKESVKYYNIESALALVITLCINCFVISVFARGFYGKKAAEDIGLENAGGYLGAEFGNRMQLIWAVGLLAAGQSSTMTGTYAGQHVMSGFLNLNISPGRRTLVTRAVAIWPTLLVALSAGNDSSKLDSLNQWINILQSVQLPFAMLPLLLLTSDPAVMGWDFCNSGLLAAACWVIAGGIITINASTAYETAVAHLPASWAARAAFAGGVTAYLAFLLYLVLTPERVGRMVQSVGSRLNLLAGSSEDFGDKEQEGSAIGAGAGGGAAVRQYEGSGGGSRGGGALLGGEAQPAAGRQLGEGLAEPLLLPSDGGS